MEKNLGTLAEKENEITKILETMSREEKETFLFKSFYENDYTPLVTLGTVFDGTHAFRIPVYQRGYVWTTNNGDNKSTKKQLDVFWEDLMRIFSACKEGNNLKHYMGMIALKRLDKKLAQVEAVAGSKAYYVVDGQQRLTTFVLLLNVISNILNEKINTDIVRYSNKAEASYNEALALVLTDEGSDEEENKKSIYLDRLLKAKIFFTEKLKDFNNEEIKYLRKVIENNIQFNVFFGNDKEASIVFETINNRGKGLTKLEVLKNRIYFLLDKAEYEGDTLEAQENDKTDLFEEVQNCWNRIFQNLGSADSHNGQSEESDNRFLRAWWFMEGYSGGKKVQEDLQIENVLEKFSLDEAMKSSEIRGYMMRMSNFSTYWKWLYNPSEYKTQSDSDKMEFKTILEKFRRLTNDIYVHSLVTGLCCSKLKGKLRDLSQFLSFLEKYVFIASYICKKKKTTDYSFMIEYGQKIYKEKSLDKIYEVLQQLKQRIYETEENSKRLKAMMSYETLNSWLDAIRENNKWFYDWNGLAYFLYERNLSEDGEDKACDWSELVKDKSKSVEHVYPEHPHDNYWTAGFSLNKKYKIKPDENKTTHSLGNLLPLSMKNNNRIKNFKYFKKRKVYEEGTITTIRFSKKYENWSIYHLAERNQSLIDWMVERWFVFDLNISYKTQNNKEISISYKESLNNSQELNETKARALNFSGTEWNMLSKDEKDGVFALCKLTSNLDRLPTEVKDNNDLLNEISLKEEAEEYCKSIKKLERISSKNKILLMAQEGGELIVNKDDLQLNDYGVCRISLPKDNLFKLGVLGIKEFIKRYADKKIVSILAENRLGALLLTDNNLDVEKKIIINPSLDYDEDGVKKSMRNLPGNTSVLVENTLRKDFRLKNSSIIYFDDSEKVQKIISLL